MSQNNDRISIQVGLSGYSFKLETAGTERRSGWMPADRIFTTPELQVKYEEVEISVFTPKCTLAPVQFCDPAGCRDMLSEVADLGGDDDVDIVDLPEYSAALVFSNNIGETLSKAISETVRMADGSKAKPLPEMYYMLRQLPSLADYNKILASYMDGYLYLAIAQGKTLLLCNSYQVPDFTTAEYFIFLAMKKLQLNPEVSTICFRTPLMEEEEMSLYRYFRNVEQI